MTYQKENIMNDTDTKHPDISKAAAAPDDAYGRSLNDRFPTPGELAAFARNINFEEYLEENPILTIEESVREKREQNERIKRFHETGVEQPVPQKPAAKPAKYGKREIDELYSIWSNWEFFLRDIRARRRQRMGIKTYPYDEAFEFVVIKSGCKSKQERAFREAFLREYIDSNKERIEKYGMRTPDADALKNMFDDSWDAFLKGKTQRREDHLLAVAKIYQKIISEKARRKVETRYKQKAEKTDKRVGGEERAAPAPSSTVSRKGIKKK
jgi:hypothetical protein